MNTFQKILTLLVMGAIGVLIITHPAGFAADSVAGGNVLDNTLRLESGSGVGMSGSFSAPGFGTVSNG